MPAACLGTSRNNSVATRCANCTGPRQNLCHAWPTTRRQDLRVPCRNHTCMPWGPNHHVHRIALNKVYRSSSQSLGAESAQNRCNLHSDATELLAGVQRHPGLSGVRSIGGVRTLKGCAGRGAKQANLPGLLNFPTHCQGRVTSPLARLRRARLCLSSAFVGAGTCSRRAGFIAPGTTALSE